MKQHSNSQILEAIYYLLLQVKYLKKHDAAIIRLPVKKQRHVRLSTCASGNHNMSTNTGLQALLVSILEVFSLIQQVFELTMLLIQEATE